MPPRRQYRKKRASSEDGEEKEEGAIVEEDVRCEDPSAPDLVSFPDRARLHQLFILVSFLSSRLPALNWRRHVSSRGSGRGQSESGWLAQLIQWVHRYHFCVRCSAVGLAFGKKFTEEEKLAVGWATLNLLPSHLIFPAA